MSTWEVLKSDLDNSVNFIQKTNPGFIECRYVRRSEDYFIIYLSSQTGCNKSCRMCWLTQTGQTQNRDVNLTEYVEQMEQVFHYADPYWGGPGVPKVVHINFMARGEVFSNQNLLADTEWYLDEMSKLPSAWDCAPKFKFSTIMPEEMRGRSLPEMFGPYAPDIYYSIYSVNPEFRKRWLPKALPVGESLRILKDYQDHSHKIIKLHWCFIEGENDSIEDIDAIYTAVRNMNLRVDINIVRYNPYSPAQGKEPNALRLGSLIHRLKENFEGLGTEVKVIPRVAPDVYVSCGQFVPKGEAA